MAFVSITVSLPSLLEKTPNWKQKLKIFLDQHTHGSFFDFKLFSLRVRIQENTDQK